MQCPECQFDNREGAKFCIDCGTKLEINCSKCSHFNPPASKFCEECGSKLNLQPEQAPHELSFDEKITKIQKYLPRGVTEKILAQKDRIEGERKQVTVMFCDMKGFTPMSEMLGIEEAYSIMDQVYETQMRIIDARTRLAGYNISLTYHLEAKDAVAPVLDLALKLNYQKRLPIIYIAMGMHCHWVEGDYSEGYRYLNEALKISEITKDTTCLWFANLFLGETLSLNCEFEKGLGYLKKSLDLGVLENNPIEIEFAKSCICAFNYILRGNLDLAYQITKESLLMAQDSGDIYLKAAAHSSYGMSCYCKGLFDKAKDSLLKAFTFSEKLAQLGWKTLVCGFLGHLYFDMAEYKKAQNYYREGVSTLERARLHSFWVNVWKISLARSKVFSNDKKINLGEGFKYYENINPKVGKGLAARYIGEILFKIDDQIKSEAEEWFKKAIEADKENGTMWSLGGDYASYAELCKQKGDRSKTRENLIKAIEIFNECSADGWAGKYKKELSALS